MEPEIVIRAYEPGDEHGLVDLFGRCFGRQITLDHWRWKMKSCSAHYDCMSVASYKNRLVGQYVGVPVDSWINGQRREAIAILDTMVDPNMRRQGVLTRVGAHAHDNWRRAGVSFGFGLPNEQWGSRAAALGWVPLFPLQWLLRILRPESVLARRLGIGALARLTPLGDITRRLLGSASVDPDIRIQEVHEARGEFDVIAKSARRPHAVQLVRGSKWVDRRYLQCPSIDYHVLLATRRFKPVGYAVYRLSGTDTINATVTEVLTDSNDQSAYMTLVAEVERLCMEARAESIRVLSVPGTPTFHRLRQCGFLPRRAAFSLQYVPLQPDLREVRNVDDWYFEGGDFDVV